MTKNVTSQRAATALRWFADLLESGEVDPVELVVSHSETAHGGLTKASLISVTMTRVPAARRTTRRFIPG